MIAKQTLHYSKQKDRLSLSPPVIALELKYCQMFVMPFLPEHTLRRLSLSPLAQRRLAQVGCWIIIVGINRHPELSYQGLSLFLAQARLAGVSSSWLGPVPFHLSRR